MLPTVSGHLYVGGMREPFAFMPKLKGELRHLHNRIVECRWSHETNEWVFMRERTDKSYPNGYNTAQGVMKSIMEPVTKDMLLEFIAQYQFKRPALPPHPSHSSSKMARTH